MTEGEQRLYDIFNMLKIEYVRYEHKPVCTIEEANQLDIYIEGKQCKNLFLRDRKGSIFYLVIVDEKKQVDLKRLAEKMGCKSLSFASEEKLYNYLALKPGAVSPFGLINDINKAVQVIIDKDLVGSSSINFHPNVNTATINISYKNFEKFLEWCGNKCTVI
ncbi:prolyl-tRNA synthetase associated domain-containing protein [Haloimpatiens sp. FM7315]|uniref:prolyl-tRNA synthetase associated domain-containing protein n=1 Tax=Haloimpatiens sp. FM7315 TaxID=3298609 RepID=UPI0035A2AEF2